MTLLVSATGITGVLTSESDSPAPYQSPPQGILDIHFLHLPGGAFLYQVQYPASTYVQNISKENKGRKAYSNNSRQSALYTHNVFGVVLRWAKINFDFTVNGKQHIVAMEKSHFYMVLGYPSMILKVSKHTISTVEKKKEISNYIKT